MHICMLAACSLYIVDSVEDWNKTDPSGVISGVFDTVYASRIDFQRVLLHCNEWMTFRPNNKPISQLSLLSIIVDPQCQTPLVGAGIPNCQALLPRCQSIDLQGGTYTQKKKIQWHVYISSHLTQKLCHWVWGIGMIFYFGKNSVIEAKSSIELSPQILEHLQEVMSVWVMWIFYSIESRFQAFSKSAEQQPYGLAFFNY